MTQIPRRTVIVLAAGEGKRMKSGLPKVLHPLLGRTLLGHVLTAAAAAEAERTLVVVGHGADQVRAHLAEIAPEVTPVLQAEQHGTGHAVRVALEAMAPGGGAAEDAPSQNNRTMAPGVAGTVVVLNGDVPLLRAETVADLVRAHEQAGAAATVLTAEVDDPTGLGRVLRTPGGALERVVEERDATPGQRAVREINAGIYAFDAELLGDALGKLSTDNDQGEEYLTDVLSLLGGAGERVAIHVAADAQEALGCNDRAELAGLRRLLRDRINADWMRSGVSILDPVTTWIDVTVTLGRDAVIDQNTQLAGGTRVASGAVVGPDTTLIDTVVGESATVLRAHAVRAEVGPGVSVGPYSYLRPGTRLGPKSKIGTFVETKNAEVGAGSKVPHLTYVGDATIGEQTNIGAATVFVNYDGVAKHHTVIGSHARTGADNMFVAPVRVGDGAYTAAGSVITTDVPPGALGIARGQQHNVEGWVSKRRPGTAAAEAAERALGDSGPAISGKPSGADEADPAAPAE